MGLKIDPSQVPATLAKIEDANQTAQQALARVQQTQEEMLQINWQGGSAATYRQMVNEQHDDCKKIMDDLNNLVEGAKAAANDMTNHSQTL